MCSKYHSACRYIYLYARKNNICGYLHAHNARRMRNLYVLLKLPLCESLCSFRHESRQFKEERGGGGGGLEAELREIKSGGDMECFKYGPEGH